MIRVYVNKCKTILIISSSLALRDITLDATIIITIGLSLMAGFLVSSAAFSLLAAVLLLAG